MNHGMVASVGDDLLGSCIWDMAMSRGEFVAFFMEISSKPSEAWDSAFVRSVGEPPLSWFFREDCFSWFFHLHPSHLTKIRNAIEDDLASPHPRFGHPTEYGRYEPGYDQQFFQM